VRLRRPAWDRLKWVSSRAQQHSYFAGALAFYIVIMLVFIGAAPQVFSRWEVYAAVFISLPIIILVAVPEVFIITAGEIDLSFPSIIGLGGYLFALCVHAGWSPVASVVVALLLGLIAGLINATLIVYARLSSLVVTLGMLFLWRGAIDILTQGRGISVLSLNGHLFWKVIVGDVFGFGLPAQMIWAMVFAGCAIAIYGRHRFGAHLSCVGDNPEAAREMGINVDRVKMKAFVFSGVAAAFAGVIAVLVNNTFYATTGDDLLLPAIAAVFVGGTPPFGGIGSVAGGVVGVFTVGFIETGLIGVGLSGFYTQFFYGLVIILSLLGHRAVRARYGP
jgi:ribose/xylose/arabinose/galactoside ABC-type transport system permease subunit